MQLEETERNFDDFWLRHEARLHQCLQLRKFEEDFKHMQHVVSRQLEVLTAMSSEMADSISRVETLLKELADYEKESEVRWHKITLFHDRKRDTSNWLLLITMKAKDTFFCLTSKFFPAY